MLWKDALPWKTARLVPMQILAPRLDAPRFVGPDALSPDAFIPDAQVNGREASLVLGDELLHAGILGILHLERPVVRIGVLLRQKPAAFQLINQRVVHVLARHGGIEPDLLAGNEIVFDVAAHEAEVAVQLVADRRTIDEPDVDAALALVKRPINRPDLGINNGCKLLHFLLVVLPQALFLSQTAFHVSAVVGPAPFAHELALAQFVPDCVFELDCADAVVDLDVVFRVETIALVVSPHHEGRVEATHHRVAVDNPDVLPLALTQVDAVEVAHKNARSVHRVEEFAERGPAERERIFCSAIHVYTSRGSGTVSCRKRRWILDQSNS